MTHIICRCSVCVCSLYQKYITQTIYTILQIKLLSKETSVRPTCTKLLNEKILISNTDEDINILSKTGNYSASFFALAVNSFSIASGFMISSIPLS